MPRRKTRDRSKSPRSRKPGRRRTRSRFTAATADRHDLYTRAVQGVEADIDFVDKEYRKLRGRPATRLREDFCGTFALACEWVKRRPANVAVGVDLDEPTLQWGREHHLSKLKPGARERVTLLHRDVRSPGAAGKNADIVLAFNFSYWIFKTREALLEYFRGVRKSLSPRGVFFLDFYGGYEAGMERKDRRKVGRSFTYIWDQESYDPLTGDYVSHISFSFPDGTRMKHAFTYHWRLWTMPEVRELLAEAGFRKSVVYLEGDGPKGDGDGEFKPVAKGEVCAAWVAYIMAVP